MNRTITIESEGSKKSEDIYMLDRITDNRFKTKSELMEERRIRDEKVCKYLLSRRLLRLLGENQFNGDHPSD